jgi:hypothetical protein
MPTNSEIWAWTADILSAELQNAWSAVTMGGQTVEQKYGLSQATCLRYKVGFLPPEFALGQHIRKQFNLSYEDIRAASGFGLISTSDGRFADRYAGRLVFPYPTDEGRITYFQGRVMDHTPNAGHPDTPKFLFPSNQAAGQTFQPLYLSFKRNTRNIIVEGHTHALRLRQEGFCAVATGGQMSNAQREFIKESTADIPDLFWIPDVDVFTARPDTFIERDGVPVFKAGMSRPRLIEHQLEFLRTIPHLRTVFYPDDFASRFPKGDQTDWWLTYPPKDDPATDGRTRFIDLLSSGKDLWDMELEAMDNPDFLPQDRAIMFARFAEALAALTPSEEADILTRAKSRLKLSTEQFRSIKNQVKTNRKEGIAAPADILDFSRTADMSYLRPGQDYKNGQLIYTVWKKDIQKRFEGGQAIEEMVSRPLMVTSSGDYFACTPSELLKRRWSIQRGSEPSIENFCWSDNKNTPFSLAAFVNDRKANTPDSGELYFRLRDFISAYAYFNNPYFGDFISLFSYCTYCFAIFDGFGYLALNGPKASGKSRVQEILQAVCFNPLKVSSASGSFLYRWVDSNPGLILLDEAEKLASQAQVQNEVQDISLILNDGYRPAGCVGRCDGDKNAPKQFRTYAAYSIANIKGLNPTLRSRVYYFPMVKNPRVQRVNEWNTRAVSGPSQDIRNRLYCWTLANAATIAHFYDRIQGGDIGAFMTNHGLHDRDRELYAPLFAVALTIDKLSDYYEYNPAIEPQAGSCITGNLVEAMKVLQKKKEELMLADDLNSTFLSALRQIISGQLVPQIVRPHVDPEAATDWYYGTALLDKLHTFQGLKYFPKVRGTETLKFVLRDKFEITHEADEARWSHNGSRCTFYRIRLPRIEEVCLDRGIPLDAEVEIDPAAARESASDSQTNLDEEPPL